MLLKLSGVLLHSPEHMHRVLFKSDEGGGNGEPQEFAVAEMCRLFDDETSVCFVEP